MNYNKRKKNTAYAIIDETGTIINKATRNASRNQLAIYSTLGSATRITGKLNADLDKLELGLPHYEIREIQIEVAYK